MSLKTCLCLASRY